ncbi:hypothetical protein ACX0G7_09910 [Flavitalea antarctica]
MLQKSDIDNFYADVERLKLKSPVASIAKQTGSSRGMVSEYLSGKKDPSANFIRKFYESFAHLLNPQDAPADKTVDRTERLLKVLEDDREKLMTQMTTVNQLILTNLNKILDLQTDLSSTSRNTLGLLKTTANHIAEIQGKVQGRKPETIKAEINKETLNELRSYKDIPVYIDGKD